MLTEEEILQLKLHKLSSEIIEGHDLKRRLKKVMESMRKMLSFTRAVLYIECDGLIEVKVAVGRFSLAATTFRWPKEEMGGVTWVFKNRKPTIQKGLCDPRVVPYYPKKKADYDVLFSIFNMVHLGAGDIALAPVFYNGAVIGVLGADKLGRSVSKEDLKHLEEFAAQAAWAFEKAELEQQNKTFTRELKELLEKRSAELKKTQEKLVHAERLAAMGELVAGVAHEIKNPLTGIKGFTELLKDAYSNDPEARQIVRGLSFSVKHLQQVVDNFLTFSRNAKVNKRKIDINQAVRDAVTLTAHQLKGMQVTVYMTLAKKLPLFKADINQLVQVFTNLFINAAHAMQPKGGAVKVESKFENNNILIKVIDSGHGIAPEDQPKIFQSFFTTKEKGKGTGLGLSISLGIVENHGGKILVDSTPGKGTTFTLVFPLPETSSRS